MPAKPRAKPIKLVKVDPSDLVITNDKPALTRVVQGNKYAALFEAMKPGQCIKCRPEETNTVAAAMRKWIANTDKTKLTVKAVSKYPEDSMGRVWMLAKGGAK